MYSSTIQGFKDFYMKDLKPNNVHNNPWLIDLWGRDPGRFETQILCHQSGVPIEGTNKFEDPDTREVWGPTRWPRNAMCDPEAFDPHLTYFIKDRVKAIGTTWWDWQAKKTIRLGYDIDSVIGHAPGVGVDDATLAKFSKLDIPYLTIIRSTRGMGRHIYIEFGEPFPTSLNHNEHAAIARALLPRLTRDARKQGLDIDFEAEKDVCGGVMWIYHVNATKDNKGYEMIKKATDVLTEADLPINWRDHVGVVTGSRSKVVVRGYTPNGETNGDELDSMTAANAKVPLDEVHDKILDALEDVDGYSMIWVDDHHICQTHTRALRELWENKNLGIRGIFETNSPGDDAKQNCFMRPRPNGGWDVYRFGEGTQEHETWDMVGKWTHTTFNVEPTFEKLMVCCGGIPHVDERRGYVYQDVQSFKDAIVKLGVDIEMPPRAAEERQLLIRMRKDGKPVITIEKSRSDKPLDFPGFVKTSQGWERVLNARTALTDKAASPEEVLSELDHLVRALKKRNAHEATSSGGTLIGWVFKDCNETWVEAPDNAITNVLKQHGLKDVDQLKGQALVNTWSLVNEPFKPEFPGGRKWNRDAAQLRYQPANLDIDEVPDHPWWDKYLNHLGQDLDIYIKDEEWAEAWNIRCGGDYLKVWIACMIRWPYAKLPYLFMYGAQETGKSMFYESLGILLTKGIVAADKALTNENGYNGELYNAVLAYIDETDVARAGETAYNRLKAWSTGLTISIHAKFQQPFEAENTCHFVQLANALRALPVFPGDTRITALQVPPIVDPIPKHTFMSHLEDEASHFIYTLLNWDIPDAPSRLRLPVIETQSKRDAIIFNEGILHEFIANNMHETAGTKVKMEEFYSAFINSLDSTEAADWNRIRVKREVSKVYPVGRSDGNVVWIGNMTFDEDARASTPYISEGNRLRKVKRNDGSENE